MVRNFNYFETKYLLEIKMFIRLTYFHTYVLRVYFSRIWLKQHVWGSKHGKQHIK